VENIVAAIDEIYVPVKRRKTLDLKVVDALAESILEQGQLVPILLRRDQDKYILVEGLHRLEACRALGETTIKAMIVQARRH
jgi:sulfiredoxin